jgi:hypothetical protein
MPDQRVTSQKAGEAAGSANPATTRRWPASAVTQVEKGVEPGKQPLPGAARPGQTAEASACCARVEAPPAWRASALTQDRGPSDTTRPSPDQVAGVRFRGLRGWTLGRGMAVRRLTHGERVIPIAKTLPWTFPGGKIRR